MAGFRAVLIVAFSALVLILTLPNVVARQGTYGFSVDWDNNIADVVPQSPAWRAGIRNGDRLDASRNTLSERLPLDLPDNGPRSPNVHERATFEILRDGALPRMVRLTAIPVDTGLTLFLTISKRLTGLIFILTGTLLLLLRPSRMTWGFYLFALGNNNAGALFYAFLPAPLYLSIDVLIGLLLTAIAPVGFLIFALRFPSGEARGWRLTLDRIMPLLFLGSAFINVYPYLSWALFAQRSMTEYWAGTALTDTLMAAGFAIVLATYFQTSGVERQRISWLIGGLAVSLVGIVTVTVLNNAPWRTPSRPISSTP